MFGTSPLLSVLVDGSPVVLREAVEGDVSTVVALLADDQLGAARDGVACEDDLQPYLKAFHTIDADPAHQLLVAVAPVK